MGTFSAALLLIGALLAVLAAAVVGFAAGRARGRRQRVRAARPQPLEAAQARTQRTRLADKLLDLQSIAADDIMIPRGEIAHINLSDDWDTILDVLRTTPHTRLPVCQDNLDHIVGILHMKKVAHALVRGDFADREQLLQLAREREAYFVPEGTTLNVQLLNFQRDRRRIALVVLWLCIERLLQP